MELRAKVENVIEYWMESDEFRARPQNREASSLQGHSRTKRERLQR
jgi:hypothetical protein